MKVVIIKMSYEDYEDMGADYDTEVIESYLETEEILRIEQAIAMSKQKTKDLYRDLKDAKER